MAGSENCAASPLLWLESEMGWSEGAVRGVPGQDEEGEGTSPRAGESSFVVTMIVGHQGGKVFG